MRKKVITGSVVLIALALLSTQSSDARIVVNYSGNLIGSAEISEEVESEVIRGGTSLLEGFAHISMFFSRVEAAELDAAELATSIEHGRKALAALRVAEEHYEALTLLFELHRTTPRSQVRLMTLNYDELARQHRLDETVWGELRRFVHRGNPDALFADMLQRIRNLHDRMAAVVAVAERGESPSLASYIAITKELTHLRLLGQYSALLFQAI